MALQGERAIAAVRAIIDAASDVLPHGVRLEVVGHGRWWTVRRVDPANPPGVLRPTVDGYGRPSFAGGPFAPLGIGTWIPLLPTRLDAKLSAVAALELLQDVVTDALGRPWPGASYRARAVVRSGEVLTWFEPPSDDAAGEQVHLRPLPLTLFS